MIVVKRKRSTCGNCSGKLQNNVTPFDVWFHLDPEDYRRCGIPNGKPQQVEYDAEAEITNNNKKK